MADRQTAWKNFSKSILSELQVGDMVEFERLLFGKQIYSHFGVYVGNGRLAHFNPEGDEKVTPDLTFSYVPGAVTRSSVERVAGGDRMRINNKRNRRADPRSTKDMLAIIKLFEDMPGLKYSLAFFNCEHFASFVRYGRSGTGSPQTVILFSIYASFAPKSIGVEETDFKAYNRWSGLLDDAYDRRFPDRCEDTVMRLEDV